MEYAVTTESYMLNRYAMLLLNLLYYCVVYCRWAGQLAITCAFFIYASIGLTVSGYFGANVAGSCNVNWEVIAHTI